MLPFLLIILLIEGFITIAVEILTMRQLTPFYGNSVVITSVIIGFFLLFLAIGYWKGGTQRDDFFKRLARNYCLAMLWIGVGLSYSFIAIFFYLSIQTVTFSLLFSLIFYLLIVLAPIVYWLGQTIPLTTNLFNQNHGVSKISGRALFLSTSGSFLGAIITSLILFQYAGVAWTLVINCACLFILVITLHPHTNYAVWKYILLSLALILITLLNVNVEKIFFKLTNNYANYGIIELKNKSRILTINESYSSLLTAKNDSFAYIAFIQDLLFKKLQVTHKNLLVVGAGGFTLTAKGTHDNQVTYIDIDPDIKKIAEKYFLRAPVQGAFIGEDARSFLKRSTATYEVILSDAYTNKNAMPASLLTAEYFNQLAQHLTPSGFVILNIIANPWFNDAYSKRINNTIHSVFKHCSVTPLNLEARVSNIIYLCAKPAPDNNIYTDDLNTATVDFFKGRASNR